jgi:(1->4)-alpha-D-glucan 1-alpha-D-glucosylmutase
MTESLVAGGAPDAVERYFVFQTLVGAWPIPTERLEQYMEKALREAKRNTNWITPNLEWEAAVKRFCGQLVQFEPFMAEFQPLARRVAALGDQAALGQLALKLASPGIPDIYQGDEIPYRALVDPDNRRPVDWERRRALLAAGDPGCEKLWMTTRLLDLRARRPQAFFGGYEPVDAGPDTCAFVRGGEVLVVVQIRGIGEFDAPQGRWRDVRSGEERSFDRRETVQAPGVAVFERMSR